MHLLPVTYWPNQQLAEHEESTVLIVIPEITPCESFFFFIHFFFNGHLNKAPKKRDRYLRIHTSAKTR